MAMDNMEPIDASAGTGTAHSVRPPKALSASALRAAGLLETSDLQGLLQVAFHAAALATSASGVALCLARGWYGMLLLAEVAHGVALSFLFAGFHETIHNTAFATPLLNVVFAHALGFLTFRGAKWFWCFHWSHHRFTNDPEKDPELSGESIDLDDPTQSLARYAFFLSGYPFGFERVPLMLRRALGDCADPWVVDKSGATRRAVRAESAAYFAGYAAIAVGCALWPVRLGKPVLVYWLLPHCLGAAHLRMYQFAEHRACVQGPYTDTSAWVCCRTTTTWWLYRALAWQMPYHVEHHAFPNVPFHKLPDAHEAVRRAYAQEGAAKPPTGCDPDGDSGYLGLHAEVLRRILARGGAGAKAAKAA